MKKLRIPKRLLNRELHIFALSSNESINARVILAFLKQAQTGKMDENKIKFYVNTTDESAEKYFEIVNKEKNTDFEVKTFSIPDITARQLFETYPIHDCLLWIQNWQALSGFTILCRVWSGWYGDIAKSIYLGQFIGGDYRAVITDGEMTKNGDFYITNIRDSKTTII